MHSEIANKIIKNGLESLKGGVHVKRQLHKSGSLTSREGEWTRIDDVVCVYIDMKNSTRINETQEDAIVAELYECFLTTAVRILDAYGAYYVDTAGDGAFGLFDRSKISGAFCASVEFRNFVYKVGHSKPANETLRCLKKNTKIPFSCHIGVDLSHMLLKKIVLRKRFLLGDKKIKLWAGSAVNVAAKLASIGKKDDIIVSSRVYKYLESKNSETVMRCKKCVQSNKKKAWVKIPIAKTKFGFSQAYRFVLPSFLMIVFF